MSSTITMTSDDLADLIRRMGKLKDQYFTVKEAAAYMRQRASTIRAWIRDGLVVAGNPTGGKLLVRKRDLDGVWKASRTTIGDDASPALRRRAENARKAVEARKAKAAERRASRDAEPGPGTDLERNTRECEA